MRPPGLDQTWERDEPHTWRLLILIEGLEGELVSRIRIFGSMISYLLRSHALPSKTRCSRDLALLRFRPTFVWNLQPRPSIAFVRLKTSTQRLVTALAPPGTLMQGAIATRAPVLELDLVTRRGETALGLLARYLCT